VLELKNLSVLEYLTRESIALITNTFTNPMGLWSGGTSDSAKLSDLATGGILFDKKVSVSESSAENIADHLA
jgi:hypothetical protein